MKWEKLLKYLYGTGNRSYGRNKGVLPKRERASSPVSTPKPQPKTYVDVNGNEYDTSKYDFVKDWIVRERKVENKLREEARRNREEARRNKATFGDELREMAKESQNRISNKAATEAQIIFDVISKDFVKQSQDGYSSVYYNDKGFEDIMTNNHIAKSKHIWKELKKICERNKIHAYLDDGIYPITYYYCFEWK